MDEVGACWTQSKRHCTTPYREQESGHAALAWRSLRADEVLREVVVCAVGQKLRL